MNPPIKLSMEAANCQYGTVPGTPKGILPIMMMGEVKGMMLVQTAKGLPGLLRTDCRMTKEKMMGMVMGNINCWASCGSSLMTLPMAAKRDA